MLFHSTSLALQCETPFLLFLQREHCVGKKYICMYEDDYFHSGEILIIFKRFKKFWNCEKTEQSCKYRRELSPAPPAFGSRLPIWYSISWDSLVCVSCSTDILLYSEYGVTIKYSSDCSQVWPVAPVKPPVSSPHHPIFPCSSSGRSRRNQLGIMLCIELPSLP